MEDQSWVVIVRAWPQPNSESGLLIRMIRSDGVRDDDTVSASIAQAVEGIREWLTEFEARTRRRDDADDMDR